MVYRDDLYQRKIIHIDMDAFYAAVESRDYPAYQSVPLIIGGRGGVVLTANYIARKFGIHSGMPSFQAVKKCPQAQFVKPRFSVYRDVSKSIHSILRRYVEPEKIEGIALDEAYLDVTQHDLLATKIACKIQLNIYEELALTCSLGVSVNKMVAKIASDFQKPNAITVVQPAEVLGFLGPLPLRKIPGVGKVSEKRLAKRGLMKCYHVWDTPLYRLVELFGLRYGKWLFRKSRGLDRAVVGGRAKRRKSLGKERTIGNGLHKKEYLEKLLNGLCSTLVDDLNSKKLKARTVTLKIKYRYDQQITRSFTFSEHHQNNELFKLKLSELLDKTKAGVDNVRLVGVSFSNLL